MLASFSGSVIATRGRTVAVQPDRQTVELIVAWVTAGLTVPGVQRRSGRAYSPWPIAWHEPRAGWACTTWPLAVEYESPLGARPAAPVIASASGSSSIRPATARPFHSCSAPDLARPDEPLDGRVRVVEVAVPRPDSRSPHFAGTVARTRAACSRCSGGARCPGNAPPRGGEACEAFASPRLVGAIRYRRRTPGAQPP